jgi:hypothetical protein
MVKYRLNTDEISAGTYPSVNTRDPLRSYELASVWRIFDIRDDIALRSDFFPKIGDFKQIWS